MLSGTTYLLKPYPTLYAYNLTFYALRRYSEKSYFLIIYIINLLSVDVVNIIYTVKF